MSRPVPEPDDRTTWLAAVRGRLDLPDAMAEEVVEELAGHLDDAAAGYRAAGLEPADADRRAIRALGDPAELGMSLARARRRGRQVLAAIGGGTAWGIADGVRSAVFIAVCFYLAAILALPVAWGVLRVLGRSTSSYFGGPVGSAVTIVAVGVWFAWMGRILPARIAPRAMRSVHGIRRPLAIAGFMVGSLAVWLVPRLVVDPVLAVGLPLGPVAFAVSALRAPDRPMFRLGVGAALGMALVLVLPLALVALLTTTPSEHGGWEADTSVIAAPADGADALPDGATVSAPIVALGASGWASLDLGSDDAAATRFAARFPDVRIEIWPATVVDAHMVFGASPLLITSVPTQAVTELAWTTPTLRDAVSVVTLIVAVGRDGHRVLLSIPEGPDDTPPWTGTLAQWWLGS